MSRRTNDIVDGRKTLAGLVDQGYTLRDAVTIRAFGILLSGDHKTQSRAYASEQITGRELLEQVAPEELLEVEHRVA